MHSREDKTQGGKYQPVANTVSGKTGTGNSPFQFVDNRKVAIAHANLQELRNNSSQVKQLMGFQEKAKSSFQSKNSSSPAHTGETIQMVKGMTKSQAKEAEKARRAKQAQASEASRQKEKAKPAAVAAAAAAEAHRQQRAAEGVKKTQLAQEKEARRLALVTQNDALINAAKNQVLTARQTPGQEHFNAGSNTGIPIIPGGTNNPINLDQGKDGFPLMNVATDLQGSVSGVVSRHYKDGDNPTIIIHVT